MCINFSYCFLDFGEMADRYYSVFVGHIDPSSRKVKFVFSLIYADHS